MKQKVKICEPNAGINLGEDYYGPTFWKEVTKHGWEPDTFNFPLTNFNSTTVLTNIGAAKGAIALRPNLNEVKTDHAVAKLVQARCHEFIIDFAKRESR